MDKNLITLNELQRYIKSKGESENEKVKIFLNNVFEIGFKLRYRDIFPMEDFECGDLLNLDYKFLYKEYLKFLEKNETYDDTLFYIAENQYANFYEKIQYSFKNLDNFKSLFKTRKQLIKEEKQRKRREEIRKIKDEFRKKFTELVSKFNTRKKNNNKSETISNNKKKMNEELSMMMNYSYSPREIFTHMETFEEKIFKQMEIKINDDLEVNIYARIRIEEHLKNIKQIREDVGSVFFK